jgi:DNA-binding transcriptional MerR regulator
MPVSYTLSQLSEMSGVRPRTLQFWSQNGVLEAEEGTKHKGTGVHRRWPQIEVEIAAVLGALERYGVTVGTLHGIGAKIRSWKRTAEEKLHLDTPEQVRAFLREQSVLEHGGGELGSRAEMAAKLKLPNVPKGSPKSPDVIRDLQWWQAWVNARLPTSDTYLRLQISADGSWLFQFFDEGTARLRWGTEDTYITVALSKILKRT